MELAEETIALQGALRALVEKMAGRKMETPKDFDFLTGMIYDRTHEQLSSFTLKRFWGYINRPGVSLSTLNILCHFVGYTNWDAFSKANEDGESESGIAVGAQIMAKELRTGDCLLLTWKPNRSVKVRFEGMDLFTIVEAENSKLSVGDTFHCSLFIDGQPLILSCLVQKDCAPVNYICGKTNGIHFLYISKDTQR